MDKIILAYVIIQLITTAFGLAVIESVKPYVEKQLHDKGYVQKNNNSLYKFNNSISNVLYGFIPLFYFVKALNIITDNKKAVDKQVQEEIRKGNYINKNDIPEVQIIEEAKSDVKLNNDTDLIFEKPEKYTARKNDISLYDTYETPIEYITRESTNDDELELSPFIGEEKVIEHVVVKDEVTKSDIAKAISELDLYELDLLKDKIIMLADMKRENVHLKLEKDVA